MCIRDSINAEYGDCPRFMADPLDKGFQDYLKQHDPQEPPARQRTVLPDSILKVLLYGTAPFFSYPFKPMLEAAEGNGYAVAYRHFRRDHQDPHNLLYLSLIHISEPTRLLSISYAVFCLKKKKKQNTTSNITK
eukprot:TRINITY_DN48899_c0_g1_i1.p3 TRINITY_DN48899_c0_g1~~TRINITY_DN48899_c0_g1_i1.p3  ORF type:complete len:134 (+),score=41.04 TRINITY_DN48899_c0_g1_i1:142-543(+)